MIFSNLSKPILVTNIPSSLPTILECVKDESFRRNLELINLSSSNFNINSISERELKGCILYMNEDNKEHVLSDILLFAKNISSIFLVSEIQLENVVSWFEICSPKYKKISNKINEYLTRIQRADMNFHISNTPIGYVYNTYGNIYINPYKGLFIAVDYPDQSFGTELSVRIHNFLCENKIDNIYTNEPTNEISGSIAQMVKKGKMELFDDTLQLLYTADRIEHARVLYEGLQNEKSIISARYNMSTLAYAYQDMPLGFLLSSNAQVYWPDVNIVLFDPKKRINVDEKYDKVNKALQMIGSTFEKTSYLFDINEGLEKATKKAFRIIRNHAKTKKYFLPESI